MSEFNFHLSKSVTKTYTSCIHNICTERYSFSVSLSLSLPLSLSHTHTHKQNLESVNNHINYNGCQAMVLKSFRTGTSLFFSILLFTNMMMMMVIAFI